ncbi:MAG: hypothetical protein ACM3ML_22165 [Micromonosporaceae bacterium]
MFKAVISLDAEGQREPGGVYRVGTHSLMVRAPCHHLHGVRRYFSAVVSRDDEQPLRPGDSCVVVTIAVADDEAPEFFAPGKPIALWNGGDVGHGTISRPGFLPLTRGQWSSAGDRPSAVYQRRREAPAEAGGAHEARGHAPHQQTGVRGGQEPFRDPPSRGLSAPYQWCIRA